MANKAKKGLEYFPCEVDLFSDIKVRKLIKYQSGKSISVYVRLLCIIYKNGYYIKWDNELPFTISEDTGFEEGYVSEVITCCLKVGLLSQRMFDEFSVLTSKGIQDRYTTICIHSKRKAIVSEFMVNNSEELPQSKVKESKPKESKGKYLIKIGNEEFFKKGSEILQEEYRSVLENHLMGALKGIDEQAVLDQFDIEYPEYDFKDRNHLSNSVKGLKEKIQKNSAKKENGQSTSKSAKTISGAYDVLRQNGISPDAYFPKADGNG